MKRHNNLTLYSLHRASGSWLRGLYGIFILAGPLAQVLPCLYPIRIIHPGLFKLPVKLLVIINDL